VEEELTPMYHYVQEPAFQQLWLVAIQGEQVPQTFLGTVMEDKEEKI